MQTNAESKKSLPSRKCGLKLYTFFHNGYLSLVTSFAEVWIEIMFCSSNFLLFLSLPSRKCGLKLCSHHIKHNQERHFLRGSVDWNNQKFENMVLYASHFLRGSVDWNPKWSGSGIFGKGHFLRGSVDWNIILQCLLADVGGHFLRGSVAWNYQWKQGKATTKGHFLRGSVDWNSYIQFKLMLVQVTSFAEVWIEIFASCCRSSFPCVTSFAEVWIEIAYQTAWHFHSRVTSFAEVWIEIFPCIGTLAMT